MPLEKLRKVLSGPLAKYYPEQTAQRFPRIVQKMVDLWGKPEMDDFFRDLLIMDRPDRQGFPLEIVSELMALSNIYDRLKDTVNLKTAETDVWDGDPEAARKELEDSNIAVTSYNLMRSIQDGNTRAIVLLLSSGIAVDSRDPREWTMLMVAAFEGNEKAAKILIQHGADIHATDRGGYSPIHWASFKGFDKLIRFLIKKGANVNTTSNAGITPLMQAAAMGHIQVVETLLEFKALPYITTKDGQTALSKAESNKHADIVSLLIRGK